MLRTATAQVVQSYGHLATALGEQYLVAFQAPGELPALAEVTVKTGDVQSRTVVRLPEAGTSADAAKPPSERWPAVVLSGLVLIALAGLALDLRAHRRASVDSGAPSAGAAGPHASTTFQAPARDAGGNGSAPPSPTGCHPAKRSADRASYLTPATSAAVALAATLVGADVVPVPAQVCCCAGTEVGSVHPRLAARTAGAAAPAARPTAAATFARRQPAADAARPIVPSTSGGQDERRATTSDIAIGYRVGDGGGSRRGRRGALG